MKFKKAMSGGVPAQTQTISTMRTRSSFPTTAVHALQYTRLNAQALVWIMFSYYRTIIVFCHLTQDGIAIQPQVRANHVRHIADVPAAPCLGHTTTTTQH